MNRISRFDRENNDADNLQKWLNESGLSEDRIINLLERNLKQRKDIQLVKACAGKIDLKPEKFTSDERIELDFELFYKDDYVCCIYKTWKDPGFRIGRELSIDKTIPDYKEKLYIIFRLCSKNFISIEFMKPEDKDCVKIMFEIGIYGDGFNEKVLRSAVETLEETMEKIYKALKS